MMMEISFTRPPAIWELILMAICICEWVIICQWTWTPVNYTSTPVGEMMTKTMTSNTRL
ncbi:hypothetical protein OCV59_06735 [Brotomerdimonas butyrica]|nr:hypothetical protein [Brotomerdimonas butyrica]